jgi:hypothetical protein
MKATGLAMAVAAAVVVAASSGGCKEAHVHEAFFPNLHESRMNQALAAQTARGARVDATLYPIHFDGAALNSLGQAKLDLMLEDGAGTGPITVYLGVPELGIDQRRTAVERYLTAAGLQPEQVALVVGANPFVTHLASDSISRMQKTENPQSAGHGEETTVKFDVSGMGAEASTK